ncbi:MAG: hypothetical protein K2I17_03155 [Clostridia bacterium]|nr:hypothetical protein [Clostridia bacterium]
MEKIVVKTAVKTVLIILGILVAVFAVFNFAFPQHMATATESIGNYDLAVKYSLLRYNYTKKCEDLARCFEDSVLLGEDKYILEYGEKLTAHHDYAEVCKIKNQQQSGSRFDYGHWVNSKLAVSYYKTGEKSKAITLAAQDNGKQSFVYGNALMSLSASIRSAGDVESATAILSSLEEIHPDDASERDTLTQVIAIIRGFVLDANANS